MTVVLPVPGGPWISAMSGVFNAYFNGFFLHYRWGILERLSCGQMP
jgi:hypothetical protein